MIFRSARASFGASFVESAVSTVGAKRFILAASEVGVSMFVFPALEPGTTAIRATVSAGEIIFIQGFMNYSPKNASVQLVPQTRGPSRGSPVAFQACVKISGTGTLLGTLLSEHLRHSTTKTGEQW